MAVGKASMARASKAASKKTDAPEKTVTTAEEKTKAAKATKPVKEAKVEKEAKPVKETMAAETPKKRPGRKKKSETAAAVEKKTTRGRKPAVKKDTGRKSAEGAPKAGTAAQTETNVIKIGDAMPIYYY